MNHSSSLISISNRDINKTSNDNQEAIAQEYSKSGNFTSEADDSNDDIKQNIMLLK